MNDAKDTTEQYDSQRDLDGILVAGTRACYDSILAHLDCITPEFRARLRELYDQSLALQQAIVFGEQLETPKP